MKVLQAAARVNLTRADIDFICTTLHVPANEEEALLQLLADEETRDAILDNPLLCKALLNDMGQLMISPAFYFYVLVRHVFLEGEINDREVADYVATLLAYYNRPATFYINDVIEKMNRAKYYERFVLSVELANQSLFATGIFPDHLRYRTHYRAAPPLSFYESVGRSHYTMAGRHHLAEEYGLQRTFSVLGKSFKQVRLALNTLKDRLIFLD